MAALQCLACIFQIVAIFEPSLRDAADGLSLIADLLYMSVCACMQTQHHQQLMYRDGPNGPVQVAYQTRPPPAATVPMAMPVQQQIPRQY
eukprot:scaffold1418_cov352-Prasinococcus_capsulatus_cf.AAC.6